MKTNLVIAQFEDIPLQEQQQINGGGWHIPISIGLMAIKEIIEDWDNFVNGLTGKPEEKNP